MATKALNQVRRQERGDYSIPMQEPEFETRQTHPQESEYQTEAEYLRRKLTALEDLVCGLENNLVLVLSGNPIRQDGTMEGAVLETPSSGITTEMREVSHRVDAVTEKLASINRRLVI